MTMVPDTSPPGPDADPDFTIYEPDYSRGARMTPRIAYWLWHSCIYLADTWRDSREDPEALLDSLPPLARPPAHGEWLDRFSDCFDDLATRIAAGEGDQERLAACTGEEMALHLAVDLAEAFVADGLLGPDVGRVSSLPDHGDDDSDFETMRDLLFTDHDVLILFDPAMDGAEIPDSELDRVEPDAPTSTRGTGSSLSPRADDIRPHRSAQPDRLSQPSCTVQSLAAPGWEGAA